jgi:hypothetical protein
MTSRLPGLIHSALLASLFFAAPALAQVGVTRPERPATGTPDPTARKSWYVRQGGNDTNRGDTPVAAFRTIQRAVDAVNDDDGEHVIYVGPGTYAEGLRITSSRGTRSGASGRPNVVFGDPAGKYTNDAAGDVIINPGTGTTPLQVQSRTDWSFRNLIFRGGSNYNLYLTGSSRLTFERCVVRPPAWYGVYATDCPSLSLIENDFERDLTTGHCTYIYNSTGGNITIRGNFLAMPGSNYRRNGMADGSFNWSRISSGGAGYPYGIIAMAYSSAAISSTINITNNIVSDCYLPLYAYVYSGSSSARFTIDVNSNTVAASMYGLYVYDYGATAATNLINNLAADVYYGSYIYTPRGTINGHMEQSALNYWDFTARSESGIITDQVPTFADVTRMNFMPAAGSPAINAGPATGAYATDFFARARPYDPHHTGTELADFGAVEYQSTKPTVKVIRWREQSIEDDR